MIIQAPALNGAVVHQCTGVPTARINVSYACQACYRHRHTGIGGASVTQGTRCAPCIHAPASRSAIGKQCARMSVANADSHGVGDADCRHRNGGVSCQAVPELTVGILAPAHDRATEKQHACVIPATRNANSGGDAHHTDGVGGCDSRSVPKLAIVALAPTPNAATRDDCTAKGGAHVHGSSIKHAANQYGNRRV